MGLVFLGVVTLSLMLAAPAKGERHVDIKEGDFDPSDLERRRNDFNPTIYGSPNMDTGAPPTGFVPGPPSPPYPSPDYSFPRRDSYSNPQSFNRNHAAPQGSVPSYGRHPDNSNRNHQGFSPSQDQFRPATPQAFGPSSSGPHPPALNHPNFNPSPGSFSPSPAHPQNPPIRSAAPRGSGPSSVGRQTPTAKEHGYNFSPNHQGSSSSSPNRRDTSSSSAGPVSSSSGAQATSPTTPVSHPNDKSAPPQHGQSTSNCEFQAPVPPSSHSSDDPLGGVKLICIFNNHRFYKTNFRPSHINPHLCTHLNYEFAIMDPQTHEMMMGEPSIDMGLYQEAVDLKKCNKDLKVMMGVGGWSDSTKKYSEMAADAGKRKNFIEKAIAFLKKHCFDGLDLAWEYPNCWQGAIGVCPQDKQNFVILLREMKREFDLCSLILSVSVGAIKREVEAAYDVKSISDAVHHINIMTYDMHGPWESVTGHHAQFDARENDQDPYCNVKAAMKLWAENGAEKKKMIMGIPLYGTSFTLENPAQCGMGAPAVGIGNAGPRSKEGGLLYYSEVCQFLNSGNWTLKEDKKAGYFAHWGNQWVCFDPPMMIVRKVKDMMMCEYGGILLKDLSCDDFEGKCFAMPSPLHKMAMMEIIHMVKRQNSKKYKKNN